MNNKKTLNILYTNIGRGHPFYLDGVCEEINRNRSDKINLNIINVFDLSSGLSFLSLSFWKLIRFMYKIGSQGGVVGKIYSFIRKNKKTSNYGFIEKILARGIRAYIKKNNFPTLVAHPMLVPMISDITDVYYQHGELIVPDMVNVDNVKSVFVPTEYAAEKFRHKGLNNNTVCVTGFSVENHLKINAQKYYDQRLRRLNSSSELVGAFFSSGAEPAGHIDKIIRMLISLNENKQKGILFCKSEGRLEKGLKSKISTNVFNPDYHIKNRDDYFKNNNILIVTYNNREEENRYTETLFEYFDYFVAPSHERTNWALGLGIPMFVLHPLIGPFSPLNREMLLRNKVALDIKSTDEADSFSENLKQLSEHSDLESMAKNGFGNYSLDGFRQICNSLESTLIDV